MHTLLAVSRECTYKRQGLWYMYSILIMLWKCICFWVVLLMLESLFSIHVYDLWAEINKCINFAVCVLFPVTLVLCSFALVYYFSRLLQLAHQCCLSPGHGGGGISARPAHMSVMIASLMNLHLKSPAESEKRDATRRKRRKVHNK